MLQDNLPIYSKGEEIFNSVSHGVGSIIGILVIIFSCLFHHHLYGLVSGVIFGSSLIFLYSMSSLYHGLSPQKIKAKKVFRVIDHCSIFILIAGSYTPLTLCVLRQYNSKLGWFFLIFIWGLAILGITLNTISLKKFKIFSAICYLLMGWSIVLKLNIVIKIIGTTGMILLITGGIAYSLGFIFYASGKKHKWHHSVFHLLCLVGSVLHSICILKYVI